jgi:hypothetical protein
MSNKNKMMQRRPKDSIPRPPPLTASLTVKHTIRFSNNLGTTLAYNITVNELLDLLCVATAANAAYRLLDSFHLRSIKMWFAASAATSSQSAAIEDAGAGGSTIGTPSKTVINSSVDFSQANLVTWRPKKFSMADNWFSTAVNSALIVLRLSVPANAIIDLSFDAYFADGTFAPTPTVTGVAGATAGQVYTRALGCATSTTGLAPVGVASI